MGTGETVAVKQVKLADLPKSELRVITVRLQPLVLDEYTSTDCIITQLEIDLLKNLDVRSTLQPFNKTANGLCSTQTLSSIAVLSSRRSPSISSWSTWPSLPMACPWPAN